MTPEVRARLEKTIEFYEKQLKPEELNACRKMVEYIFEEVPAGTNLRTKTCQRQYYLNCLVVVYCERNKK